MKTLLIGLALAAGAVVAAEPNSFHAEAATQPPAQPALYSFVDVYRLTVAGVMAGLPVVDTAPEAPIRVAAGPAQAAEPRFFIAPGGPPDKWLLLLAGLALAGWVARRRMGHSL